MSDNNRPSFKLTMVTEPFEVDDDVTLHQCLIALSSWLIPSKEIKLHLNQPLKGMGSRSDELVNQLTKYFGKDRVIVKGKIIKKGKIETISEIFETLLPECETDLVAYVNNDIILPPDYYSLIMKLQKYCFPYKNCSLHIPRFNLRHKVRSYLKPEMVLTKEWPNHIKYMLAEYSASEAMQGYDFLMFNKAGFNFTKFQFPPMHIGRPDFEYIYTDAIRSQGWFASTYPSLFSLHMNHPERKRYAEMSEHPDVVRAQIISSHLGVHRDFNSNWGTKINMTHAMWGKGKRAKSELLTAKKSIPFGGSDQ